MEIYEEAVKTDTCEFTGRGSELIASGVVVIGVRKTGDVRTVVEIAEAAGNSIHKSSIHKTMKYLLQELNFGLVLPNPQDFVDYIGESINATEDDINEAQKIADELTDKKKAQNQSAKSIAATTLYYVGAKEKNHGKYTQEEIANAVDISTLTVRNNYKRFADVIESQIEPELANH
jgi:transcription initiation factor TFIIIB Brf1 subunit/transcription initiation factor TFIIB